MPDAILTAAIDAVAAGRDLSAREAADALGVIVAGNASEIQTAGLLIGLRAKGESQGEIEGLARTMRAMATPVVTSRPNLVDTAGTGGGRQTFNVSTTAALIAAAAGCAVAKHGNRSATGRSGSADLLEALGVRIDLAPDAVGRCIDELGFGFMFAPAHHRAMKHVVPVRQELAVRTIFNLLGPLLNPAGARRQIIGVSDPAYLDRIAGALAGLGIDRALVVCSADELDEMSVAATTTVVEVNGTTITQHTVDPQDVGLALHTDHAATAGGDPAENAAITRAIFSGQHEPGSAPHDLTVLNAGAAIYAAAGADDLPAGVRAAAAAVADGRAQETLDALIALTGSLAPA